MGEPSGQEHESEGLGQCVSVMRSFFESKEEFLFTNEIGKCGPDRNHCEIGKNNNFPFKHKEIFKGKCYIDRWVVDLEKAPTFSLKRPFVTKTLHEQKTSRRREEETKAEISVMKNLRHPHVAVFLGTWKRYDRLSILIFPAARFDLGEFMKTISDDLEELRASASPPLASSRSEVKGRCEQKLYKIQRYFVCLSQALTYLHKQGVRHKDIKPKNILIDESGSAVLTDFGISKHFALNVSHDTREHHFYDPKYVSPEMYENDIRGDPLDVFSLGCVFLEMVTLLVGKTLKDLDRHYIPKASDPDIPIVEYGYYMNLNGVYKWLKTLGDINGAPHLQRFSFV